MPSVGSCLCVRVWVCFFCCENVRRLLIMITVQCKCLVPGLVCVCVCLCVSAPCQDIDQLFGELAKWVRKRLHSASDIDEFVASLTLFLNDSIHRPFDSLRRVLKMNTIRDWKACWSNLWMVHVVEHVCASWQTNSCPRCKTQLPLVYLCGGVAWATGTHSSRHWWTASSPLVRIHPSWKYSLT